MHGFSLSMCGVSLVPCVGQRCPGAAASDFSCFDICPTSTTGPLTQLKQSQDRAQEALINDVMLSKILGSKTHVLSVF